MQLMHISIAAVTNKKKKQPAKCGESEYFPKQLLTWVAAQVYLRLPWKGNKHLRQLWEENQESVQTCLQQLWDSNLFRLSADVWFKLQGPSAFPSYIQCNWSVWVPVWTLVCWQDNPAAWDTDSPTHASRSEDTCQVHWFCNWPASSDKQQMHGCIWQWCILHYTES